MQLGQEITLYAQEYSLKIFLLAILMAMVLMIWYVRGTGKFSMIFMAVIGLIILMLPICNIDV